MDNDKKFKKIILTWAAGSLSMSRSDFNIFFQKYGVLLLNLGIQSHKLKSRRNNRIMRQEIEQDEKVDMDQ